MPSSRLLLTLLLATGLASAVHAQGNILLVIADDLGVDRVAAYGEHPDPGQTPVIDGLARRGVLFRNAWANPLCSPTRATILTGRYSFRTGLGTAIRDVSGWEGLGANERTLPDALFGGPYRCEAVGKWHLSTLRQGGNHPLESGFCHHRGSIGNIDDYYAWPKYIDGDPRPTEKYATTDTVDDAIALVRELPEPWFIWLAFNAPHGPLHAPPEELHSFELTDNPWRSRGAHQKAMTQAMDAELGRLLEVLDEETTIIFVGDNGTFGQATTRPFKRARAKGTVFEGGVNVPLIIAGPRVAVPGSECAGLVSTTDLFATICELANASPRGSDEAAAQLDSVSLLPYLEAPDLPSLRETVFAETFVPNGRGPYRLHDRAIRGARYKLIRRLAEADLLYDLVADPFETRNLLQQEELQPDELAAYRELESALDSLLPQHD